MNYQRIYDQLIERSTIRIKPSKAERHHILPKCIGGTDTKNNLVWLTPEEHFVAHQLLVRIHPHSQGLWYAVHMMSKRIANNKQYGWIRKGWVVPISSRSSLKGYQLRYGVDKGQKLYDKHRVKKDSASLDHYVQKYGKKEGERRHTERSVAKSNMRSSLNIGFTHTKETKQKISEKKIGKKLKRTKEHNRKIGDARRGKPQFKLTCPHCGLSAGYSNVHRWHMDNCKKRLESTTTTSILTS